MIPSWKTSFHLECKNQYWSPLPYGSRFQGQCPTGNVEPGYMWQCKSFISIFPHLSGTKYVWAISWQFPFSQSTQITTVLKVNHFLPWKCPVSFYPFSFKLRNSLTQTLTLSKISATTIQVFGIQVQSTSGKVYFSLLPSKIRKIYFYPQNPEQSHICISYRIHPSWSFQLLMCFSIDKWQNKSGFLKRGSSISHSEEESKNLTWAALWDLKLTGKKEFSWTSNFFLSCLHVLQKKFHRNILHLCNSLKWYLFNLNVLLGGFCNFFFIYLDRKYFFRQDVTCCRETVKICLFSCVFCLLELHGVRSSLVFRETKLWQSFCSGT